MCNSSYFDPESTKAQKLLDGKQRTSSFDLNLFRINQFWDEGTGLDYQRFEIQQGSDNNITFVESAVIGIMLLHLQNGTKMVYMRV